MSAYTKQIIIETLKSYLNPEQQQQFETAISVNELQIFKSMFPEEFTQYLEEHSYRKD